MSHHNQIAVIQGSIRAGRINDRVTAWVVRAMQQQGYSPDVIDPADPEFLPIQTGDEAAAARLTARLEPAAAYVVVTPEYNHAAPGPLKTLIDSQKHVWQAKPVGFVSYGGISGGLRAVEALRPVFAELHAVTLRDTVSFAAPWNRFDDSGRLTDPEDHAAASAAMSHFGDRLRWWIAALGPARAASPYDRKKAA
ncbi:NAD(P)H-dependent FMN reductase [Paracoccus isoporae]|uniref:NAD(P)H-dependent FMN reductase n=1 Tax=Paracoccus isoporae TaxID=591205 RepID=A0A1G6UPR4_9RHOB|nr:NAD(P)H-dependent oxidoreductase [Paracoccus isoporae]SDD43291.1 NAD(P)H-dependent FMN reductase [Paracoccus isoporae]